MASATSLDITLDICSNTWERTWAGLLLPLVVKIGVWGTVRRGAGEADLIINIIRFGWFFAKSFLDALASLELVMEGR